MKFIMSRKDDIYRHRTALAAYCLRELNEVKQKEPEVCRKWDEITFYSLVAVRNFTLFKKGSSTLSSMLPFLLQANSLFSVERAINYFDHQSPIFMKDWRILSAVNNAGYNPVVAAMPEMLIVIAKILGFDPSLRVHIWTWRNACNAVINLGDAAATSEILAALEKVLREGSNDQKLMALKAVGAIGERAATKSEILTSLATLLGDESVDIQRTAFEAVGKIGIVAATPEFLASLTGLLRDKDSAWSAANVAYYLGEAVANEPAILTALADILREGDGDPKWVAIQAVGQVGAAAATPEILSALATILREGDKTWKLITSKALDKIGAAAATQEFLASLARILREGNSETKRIAGKIICSLGEAATHREFLEFLASLLQDEDTETKRIAIKASGLLGQAAVEPEILIPLLTLCRYGPIEYLSIAPIAVSRIFMAATAAPDCLAHLVTILREGDPELEFTGMSVANMLGLHESFASLLPNYLKSLAALLCDGEVQLTDFFQLSLLGTAAATPEIISIVTSMLRYGDDDLKVLAASGLGAMGPAARKPEVMASLAEMLSEGNDDQKLVVSKALDKIRENDPREEPQWFLASQFRDKDQVDSGVIVFGKLILPSSSLPSILKSVLENPAYFISLIAMIGAPALNPEVLLALANLLRDELAEAKEIATKLVGVLGTAAATSEVLAALANMLWDEDEEVKQWAVDAIDKLGAAASTPDFRASLAKILHDGDTETKRMAVKVVGILGDAAAKPDFLASLATMLQDGNIETQESAAKAVGHLGVAAATPSFLASIAKIVRSDFSKKRVSAIKVLSMIAKEISDEELCNLINAFSLNWRYLPDELLSRVRLFHHKIAIWRIKAIPISELSRL